MAEKSKKGDNINDPERGDRIAKVLARLGVCSRRDAERMIEERRVKLNGNVVTSPATFIKDGDNLTVDGNKVSQKQIPRLFIYHKPPGQITTAKDPQGRPTVFDNLPSTLPRLISVGRLDLNTEGLLLLTNDGELSRTLELPATGLLRTYRVRVHGTVNEKRLASLKNGLTWNGVRYGSIDARMEKKQDSANTWMTVSLSEGKNREIRYVMEALGLTVNRLIRLSYGPFTLDNLEREGLLEVRTETMKELLPKDLVAKIF